MRPQVLIGDVLTAVRTLEIGDEAKQEQVARLLGMALARAAPEPDAEANTGEVVRPAATDSPRRSAAVATALPVERVLPSRLTPYVRTASDATDGPPAEVPALEAPGETKRADPPDLAPLLRPEWARGIYSAAVATRAEDGPIDVDATVDRLARNEPLESLPRLTVRTMRHGVQVLCDLGEGMLPFSEDQAALIGDLQTVLGAHRVHVLSFAGSPARAGTGDESSWTPYEPPRPGTPVLLVSDLGRGRPPGGVSGASVREWLGLARALAAARVPLVALVPYPRERVPAALLRAFPVIAWDRTTTAGMVRALVGRAVEVSR